ACPSASIRLASRGRWSTYLPVRKNVALARSFLRILSSFAVCGPGPSSKVSARHLTLAQSIFSGAAAAGVPLSVSAAASKPWISTAITLRPNQPKCLASCENRHQAGELGRDAPAVPHPVEAERLTERHHPLDPPPGQHVRQLHQLLPGEPEVGHRL